METVDSNGDKVIVGDEIKVLEIDKAITRFLPKDEVQDLESFLNNVFKISKINTDGSMVVAKQWEHPEAGLISGHELAIFPNGSLLVKNNDT